MKKKNEVTPTKPMFTMTVYIRNKGRNIVSQIDFEKGNLTVYTSDVQDKKETVRFEDIITFEIEHKDTYIFMPKEKIVWN